MIFSIRVLHYIFDIIPFSVLIIQRVTEHPLPRPRLCYRRMVGRVPDWIELCLYVHMSNLTRRITNTTINMKTLSSL